MRNKGFTLIELLAVVVILAIIAIIAIPIIINLINESRESANLVSAKLYLKQASKAIARYQLTHLDATIEGDCDVQANGSLLCDIIPDQIQVEMSGDTAICGKFTVTDGKIVDIEKLTIGDYEFSGASIGDLEESPVDENSKCSSSGGETEPIVYLKDKIMEDNEAQSDAGINFQNPSSYVSDYAENIDINSELYNPTEYNLYGTGYSFSSSTGKFSVYGDTSDGYWDSSMTYYAYICENPDQNSECDVLYEIDYVDEYDNVYMYKHTSFANVVDSNGRGFFYTTHEPTTSYYFRGNVYNNYVNIGGHLFRIIRINEDGSIRIISSTPLAYSTFNDVATDNAHVGYMYGQTGSSSYAATHANTNSSTVKQLLDGIYAQYLDDYDEYLADAGFCGDRSLYTQNGGEPYVLDKNIIANYTGMNPDQAPVISDSGLGYGENITLYGAFYRAYAGTPTFQCINKNDLYTVSNTNGNGALTYKIGLISLDEAIYAGGALNKRNTNYYLFLNNNPWWTMSPMLYGRIDYDETYRFGYESAGVSGMGADTITSSLAVRPVINLKNDVVYLRGDGTYSDPYQIKLRGA